MFSVVFLSVYDTTLTLGWCDVTDVDVGGQGNPGRYDTIIQAAEKDNGF